MPFSIRTAQYQDVDYLPAIDRAAEVLFPEGLLPKNGATLDVAALNAAVEAQQLLVAEVSERIVGFALSGTLADHLHLYEMSVHPEFGRRGIGRGLVERTKTTAQGLCLPGVTLTTFSHIPWNGPFYERCGFVPLNETQTSPELVKILQQEVADGFTHRIAMRALLA